LQLIGAPWSEAWLLSIAAGYEALSANAPWRDQNPTDLAALGGVA
jgi:Asp-tRNA(Asn)/Glu-tRNA(Gln) amidotransferase A subunit family amidase